MTPRPTPKRSKAAPGAGPKTTPRSTRRDHFRRTVRSMGVSVFAHILLLLLLIFRPLDAGTGEILTAIAYYEELPSAPEPAAVAEPMPTRVGTQPEEVRFSRDVLEAEDQPEPQSDYALTDRMAARLDALRDQRRKAVAAIAETPAPTRMLAAGPPSTSPPGATPVDLTRGQTTRAPIALQRGASVAPTRLDAAKAATPAPRAESSEPADAPTSTRQLAGALLSGPVADRPILTQVTPEYPEWAKRDAVEASVTLRFVVLPDGRIKENVFVQKTAGFNDFDVNAIAAIRAWRFQPLMGGRTGEQWGTITFHYRLRDAG